MRKMYTLTVLGAVFMTTVICNSAVGQTACPGTYERADRPAMIAYYESASFDLQVLASLAEDAASQWFIDEDLGVDDPQVHKNVYNTFRSYLFSRGTLHNNQLSAKGNQFVAAVFNNNFLQIPDLFPDGELSHPIAYYAREALDKINGATANLELCLRSSWDRMDVTDNTVGSCRSGFSLSDLGKVLTQYVKIISKLFDPYFETDDNILTEIITKNEMISKNKKNKKLKGKK